MRKQVLGCLGVILVLALMASLMANVLFSGLLFGDDEGRLQKPKKFEQTLVQPSEKTAAGDGPAIAQIDLTGVISGDVFGLAGESVVSRTKRALDQALADGRVKAIVLRIDSPGGEVTASDTIYQAVKRADARKPVITFMDSVAASGGYYIACGTRRIVATPNTWTGSIGVIVQTLGYSGLFDKVGLEMRVFRSGALKDTLYGHRKMTVEEEKYLQEMVMQTYERFVGIVSAARGIPADQLKSGIADGRVVSGTDALGLKLVDKVGYLEDAWQLAREEAGLKDAEVVHYTSPRGLALQLGLVGKLLGEGDGGESRRADLEILDRLLPRLQPGRVYLMPESMAR